MSTPIAGYVGFPQPHWYQHTVTVTEGPDWIDFTVTLMPAYGFWRGKARWRDNEGIEHMQVLTDLVTWDAPCAEDPMGHRLYLHATIPDDD